LAKGTKFTKKLLDDIALGRVEVEGIQYLQLESELVNQFDCYDLFPTNCWKILVNCGALALLPSWK